MTSSVRNASSLVVVDHDGTQVSPASLGALAAAQSLGGEVSVLVAGESPAEVSGSQGVRRISLGRCVVDLRIHTSDTVPLTLKVASNAAKISGVTKVLVAGDASLKGFLAGTKDGGAVILCGPRLCSSDVSHISS